MRYLYQNFGLEGQKWTQGNIPAALEAITGSRFDGFFEAYLYTSALLPLDGSFVFVEH